MPRNGKSACNQRAPCALQHFWRRGHGFTGIECQMAFQNWVAYDRANSSDVSPKEHLMCPLLWCRNNFDNLASVLQHVAQCPCLSNGWYWCPYCCRPERFMNGQESIAEYPLCLVQRKGSKLKRAKDFFKHLGAKTCGKAGRLTKLPINTVGTSEYTHEKADASRKMLGLAETIPAELPGCSRDDRSIQSKYETQAGGLHEMAEQPPRYNEVMGVEISRPKSSTRHSNEASGYVPVYEQMDSALQEVSAQPCASEDGATDEDDEDMLVSPRSPIQGLFTHRPTANLSCEDLPEVVNPTFTTLKSTQSFNSSRGTVIGSPAATAEASSLYNQVDSSPKRALASTQSQIEELRDLVHILNFEWMKRLDSAPGFRVPSSELYVPWLFEVGAQTLQRCYQDMLPSTFKEIFALMHIAFAAAYMTHGHSRSSVWRDLFQNVFTWQYVMVNDVDARLLVSVTRLLWCPDDLQVTTCGNSIADQIWKTIAQASKPGPLAPTTMFDAGELYHGQPSEAMLAGSLSGGLNLLKDGPLIRECSKFFMSFEHLGLIERNIEYPTHLASYAQQYDTHIQEMVSRLTMPLRRWNHVDALRDYIIDTEYHLRNGSLRCTREVEVWLSSSGKPASVSNQIYQRFLEDVTAVCNDYMHDGPLRWREPIYVADLDKVLAISLELDNIQKQAAATSFVSQAARSPAATSTESSFYGLSTSMTSTERRTRSESSSPPVALTRHWSPSSSESAVCDSSSPSPNSCPTQSSLSSPPSDVDGTFCGDCGITFKGLPHDRISNLNRHMRTTRMHGNSRAFRCNFGGCGSTFSRSDNLKKHLRGNHKRLDC